MTGSASEHSLLHDHSSHSHSHQRLRHQHASHEDHHHPDSDPDPLQQHGLAELRPREAQAQAPDAAPPQINTNLVTQVIQTVSLIQYVDPAGSPYETQTFYAAPNTVVIDTVSGNTVAISPPDAPSLTAAADSATAPAVPVPAATQVSPAVPPPESAVSEIPGVPPASTSLPPAPEPQPSEPPAALPEPSLPPPSESLISSDSQLPPAPESSTQPPAVTSAPLPPSSSLPPTSTYPTFLGSLNSTNSALSSIISSISVPSNSTLSALAETSSPSSTTTPDESTSSRSSSRSSSRTSTLSSTILSSISSDFPSSTGTATETGGIGGGAGGAGDGIPGAAPTDTAPADSGNSSTGGLSPKDKQVIGGVVGSVAGFAMLAMLLLLLLRHRRKKDGRPLFGSGPGSTSRAITDGGGDGPSDPPMRERGGPFAVASALSSLNKKAPSQPAPAEERGFYRVSGKKLPSVLHTGGDGYTDPRESVASGNSDYFRGSQEFDPSVAGGGRLALGTPMRPVSGVPIIRTGPARVAVAVADDNPFADPPPPHDPLGRSLISQDGSRISRGSGSRFQERI